MRRVIPDALEPWLVLLAVSAYFFISALRLAMSGTTLHLDDRILLSSLVIEGVFAIVFVPWLAWRGWRLDATTEPAGPFDVVRGIGVWFAITLVLGVVYGVLKLADHDFAASLDNGQIDVSLTRAVIVAVSVLNAVFEEFLWLGYGVTALGRRIGVPAACAVSVVLRSAVHVYEGWLAVVGVFPVGLVFTLYYAKSRRIWPVIVAHALLDATSFAALTAATHAAR